MRRLSVPNIPAANVFDGCLARLQKGPRSQRLTSVKANIPKIEAQYHASAGKMRLDSFSIASSLLGSALNSDFVYLYDTHFVRKKSWGRPIYDKLKLSARGNICPYCGQLPVRTLDHYLPKDTYGALSLVALNLIPSCHQCNMVVSRVVV